MHQEEKWKFSKMIVTGFCVVYLDLRSLPFPLGFRQLIIHPVWRWYGHIDSYKKFWWIKCKIHQHDKNQQATEIFVHWALRTVQHYAINIFNHQCMVLVLKPLKSHKIQQALSFHALLCDSIMPLHGARQREKQQHVKSDPWSSLLAPDSLHQCSGKTWDTWERFALQIILDLEYRFTPESLPNSQTSMHKLEDRLCFFSYCFKWAVIRVLLKLVSTELRLSMKTCSARLMGGCSAGVEKAEPP